VTTVTATDADLPTQSMTYSISGGSDSTLFSINPSTGELTFIAAPDYEMQKDTGMDNIYNVIVQASDGMLAITQDISVTVIPVNDNTPVITSAAGFSISENTMAITTITAADFDQPAQTLIYSISGGADSPLFTINSSTGVLAFVTSHNYEIPNDVGVDNIYNVTVQASDGTLNITQNIAVSILPVNDNSPTITSPNIFSIPENTSTIATLVATDTDRPSQSLTYSIISGLDALKFSIVSATGELKFIIAPDFEIPTDLNLDNIYEIVVQISDGTYNITQHIAISVTNAD
jgi:serralysin